MLHDYVRSLSEDAKYSIRSYEIDTNDIVLFIDEVTTAQSEIPQNIDGRKIIIVKLA